MLFQMIDGKQIRNMFLRESLGAPRVLLMSKSKDPEDLSL
jgi:hypothetical protein